VKTVNHSKTWQLHDKELQTSKWHNLLWKQMVRQTQSEKMLDGDDCQQVISSPVFSPEKKQ